MKWVLKMRKFFIGNLQHMIYMYNLHATFTSKCSVVISCFQLHSALFRWVIASLSIASRRHLFRRCNTVNSKQPNPIIPSKIFKKYPKLFIHLQTTFHYSVKLPYMYRFKQNSVVQSSMEQQAGAYLVRNKLWVGPAFPTLYSPVARIFIVSDLQTIQTKTLRWPRTTWRLAALRKQTQFSIFTVLRTPLTILPSLS